MTANDAGRRTPQREVWTLPLRACLCSNPKSLTIGTREGQLVRVCGLCWKRLSAVE